MAALTRIYFDFDGGRAEPARLAMIVGGLAVEDKRISFSEWGALRDNMPLRALPVLEVDGKSVLTQSNTNRGPEQHRQCSNALQRDPAT